MNNKKRIGTMTFHVAHNYGAMLQAYALPKAVQTLGYDCEIIHYCFPYIYQWSHVESLPDLWDKHGVIGGSLRYIKRHLKGTYSSKLKINKFDSFMRKTLPLSRRAYKSKDELGMMNYDAILFGSDQIWNSKLTGGIAEEFVGGFPCKADTKRIAYAASCGRSSFLEEEKKHYYPLLKDFSAIGIREAGLCASLCEDGFHARQVIDPTLLLSKEDWNKMAASVRSDINVPKNPYLLVYVFDEAPSIYRFIEKVAKKYGLEIHIIAYRMKSETEKYHVYTNCGPADFVRLFADASAVVTTSFHGTAFSIIYEKELFCIPHPTLHERTDSLLALLGLENRNCTSEVDLNTIQPIDWNIVRSRLELSRQESFDFLKTALSKN